MQDEAQNICNQQVQADMRDKLCWFDIRFAEKTFKTQNGNEITKTEVRVRKITPCW